MTQGLRRLVRAQSPWDLASALALAAMAAVVLAVFRDFGIIWDEEVQQTYGALLLHYYLSGFSDRSLFVYQNLYLYGGTFDLAAVLLQKVLPTGVYETRHLLGGLIGVAGITGAWRLGRLLGGPRAGFAALLMLALTPLYFGHMFTNPKDVPLAAFSVWTVYLMARILRTLPVPPWRLVLGFGLLLGLTLGTRIGGVITAACLVPLLFAWAVAERQRTGASRAARQACRAAVRLAPALAVAYAVMAVFWPWAVQSPLNPVRAILAFSHFAWPNAVLFEGTWIKATALPASYLPVMLAVQLPETLLAALVLAVVCAGLFLFGGRAERAGDGPADLVPALLVLSAAVPLLYAMAARPVLYNGFRHFIFVLPSLAVLAGWGLDRTLTLLDGVRWRRRALEAVFAAGAVWQVNVLAVLHPDQAVYYNSLVGGPEGAKGRFELDYWGWSLDEAAQGLERFLALHRRGDREIAVFVCGHPLSAMYHLPRQFRLVGSPDRADFLISWTQDDCDRKIPGRTIVEVARMGANLSVVKDLRPTSARSAAVPGMAPKLR